MTRPSAQATAAAAFALDRVDFPGKTAFRRLILLPLAEATSRIELGDGDEAHLQALEGSGHVDLRGRNGEQERAGRSDGLRDRESGTKRGR